MMSHDSKYFSLSLESLRSLGHWAADCAERALPIFEKHAVSDPRPRAAIDGIRVFAGGEKRAAQLRTLALAALAAAREVGDPAAEAAARAAGFAASSAYTHPLADVAQTKHIVGPAAYAALALELDHAGDSKIGDDEVHWALELDHAGDSKIGDDEVHWALEHVPVEVREILLQMPARPVGKSRLDKILYDLDAGIRSRTLS
jgi:hypothetical protein